VAIYEDDKQFIGSVLKDLRQWLDSHTYQGMPLDKADEADLMRAYVSKKYKFDSITAKKGSLKRVKSKVRHVSTYQTPSVPDSALPFQWMGDVTRRALGLSSPIPLGKLEEYLKRIEALREKERDQKNTKVWTYAWYPKRDLIAGAHNGLHVWEIDTAWFPDIYPLINEPRWKFRLEDAIEAISSSVHCHPALALVFLLCNRPLHQDIVTAVIDPFYRISVYVRGPEIPMWLVTRISTFARVIALMWKRGIAVKAARPRARSERVSTLIDFVRRNERLNWKQRRDKWENKYPQWKYDSENTMRVVYYRARPRLKNQKEGRNEFGREGGKP